jgi:pimeloyl-ACP methyl ester carboxylesterase
MSDVVLVPGLLCDGALWAGQLDALGGPGRARVADLGAGASVASMAEAVLEAAPERFALAGFSLGGWVALEMVARAPARIERLALLSTTPGALVPSVREHLRRSIALLEAGDLEPYLVDAFVRYVAPARANDATLYATFAAMGRRIGAAAGVRQMRALVDQAGGAGDPSHVACPTVVAGGALDHRTPPAEHAALARAIPGAVLRTIDGAAHFTPLERPDAVADVLVAWLGMPA